MTTTTETCELSDAHQMTKDEAEAIALQLSLGELFAEAARRGLCTDLEARQQLLRMELHTVLDQDAR